MSHQAIFFLAIKVVCYVGSGDGDYCGNDDGGSGDDCGGNGGGND